MENNVPSRKDRKLLNLSNLKQNLEKLFHTNKFKNIVIYTGILGMLLIFISGFFKTSNSSEIPVIPNDKNSSETYARTLEKNLREIICSIKNVGNIKILVTLETDSESIYAVEEKNNNEQTEDNFDGETTRRRTSNDIEKKYITIRDVNGAERALKITEIQPKIKGVVVICDGGGNIEIKKKIIETVTTALNISSKKVYVTN